MVMVYWYRVGTISRDEMSLWCFYNLLPTTSRLAADWLCMGGENHMIGQQLEMIAMVAGK